jgi:ATP-dependent Lon protease
MNYLEGIETIQKYTSGSSVEPVLDFIKHVPHDEEGFARVLDEIGGINKYPDTLVGLLSYMSFILSQKKKVNDLYEQSLDRYEQLNQATAKRRPTDEEAKIKKTLTDFILKVEKVFEIQDFTDESLVKELNRFVSEANLYGITENEVKNLKLATKTVALIESHLDKHRENYYQYKKLKSIFERLIRISDYILADVRR